MKSLSPWKFQTLLQIGRGNLKIEPGGKGQGLIQLTEMGLPVPEAALFDLKELDLWMESQSQGYRGFQNSWAFWRVSEITSFLSAVQKGVSAFPLSVEWNGCVEQLRKTLGQGDWLVRSSMSCEDSGSSSFAGCFETLRVNSMRDAQRIGAAALQVLMSAFQPSSLQRIMAAGVDPRKFRTGFLVQSYIRPVLAGACFTRDPSHLWAESASTLGMGGGGNGIVEWGNLGEAVVQGTTSFEQLQFAKRSSKTPEALLPFWERLWLYSDQIEKSLGAPAEWEWVWDGDVLWVVQARRVATEEAALIARTRPGGRWSRELALERFPEPLTPMGWTVLQDAFRENLKSLDKRFGIVAKRPEDIAVCLNGVVYTDPGFFNFPEGVRIRWSRYLLPWKSGFWALTSTLVLEMGRFWGGWLRARNKEARKISRAILRLSLIDALLTEQAAQIEENWASHRDQCLSRLQALRGNLEPRLECCSPIQRLSTSLKEAPTRDRAEADDILKQMEILKELSVDFLEPDLAIFLIKDTYYKALLGVWSALGKPLEGLAPLIRLSQGNRTLEMNLEWKAFVKELRQEPEARFRTFCSELSKVNEAVSGGTRPQRSTGVCLRPETRNAWQDFLLRNKHSRTSWDIAVADWGENPAQLIPVMKAARQSKKQNDLEILPVSERSAFEEIQKELLCLSVPAGVAVASRRQHRLIERVLKRVEAFMRMDEEQHFLSGLLLDPSRVLIRKGAEILVQEGLLRQWDDVFFLQLNELKETLGTSSSRRRFLGLAIEKRAAEWKRSFTSRHPMEMAMGNTMDNTMTPPLNHGTDLKGIPVSPGKATGIVHIAEHLGDADHLPVGAVLITTSPNPALTPLYPYLAGLISVTGGPLSHGFVAAREYGLPAVSGIPDATQRLKPGMKVRLDGTSGTIEILKSEDL